MQNIAEPAKQALRDHGIKLIQEILHLFAGKLNLVETINRFTLLFWGVATRCSGSFL